jgi:hypothetical protein
LASAITGDRAVGHWLLEQQPWIRALGVRRCQAASKREPPVTEKALARRDDPRIPRLIQIQAARIVSWQQAQGLECHGLIEVEQIQCFSTLARVRITDDGQQRFDDEVVPADT